MAATAGIESPRRIPPALPSRPAVRTCHIAFVGDISGTHALRLQRELISAAGSSQRVLVNLSRATHLSLIAMQSLVQARRVALARGARLDLQDASRAAFEAFARAGMRWGVAGSGVASSRAG